MRSEIIVSNVGMVWSGQWNGDRSNHRDGSLASAMFNHYCRLSQIGYGRIKGETVTWMVDDEPFREFEPPKPQLVPKPEPKPIVTPVKGGFVIKQSVDPLTGKAWCIEHQSDLPCAKCKPEPKPEPEPKAYGPGAGVINLSQRIDKVIRKQNRRKPTRNERQLESGYQAYSREEESTCDF